ncbi:MAG: hypothetical protein NT029_06250 [Armatimonadetes bacterium]|nr:hypothetical protein [Armatimonadota bacterium]
MRYHLGLGTWLERAGFCPGATPDVAEVRRLEGLRLQSIAASGLAAVEAEALTRAVHHAADEAAFMAAHQLER